MTSSYVKVNCAKFAHTTLHNFVTYKTYLFPNELIARGCFHFGKYHLCKILREDIAIWLQLSHMATSKIGGTN